MNKPVISFVCPSYNHEMYVDAFIDSVLKQTVDNWELIIIDDNSSDNNAQRVEKYDDNRIVFIKNKYNRGMAYGLNKGIDEAKADIISFIASDDMLFPNYIEEIIKGFDDENVSVVYCPLQHISDDGAILSSMTQLPTDRSTEEIYADLFIKKNQLPSPGMAFRKEVFAKYQPINLGIIQYTDWQMHMFLLFEGKHKFVEKPLVYYRRSENSASSKSNASLVRENIETDELMNTVLNQITYDINAFNRFFAKHPILDNVEVRSETIPFWLGCIALTSDIVDKQKWGIKTIVNYISSSEKMELLNSLYGFSYKDYMKLGNLSGTDKVLVKLKKYKKTNKILMTLLLVLGVMFVLVLG